MKLFFSDFVPCGAAHITRALQHLGDEAALGNGDDDAAKPTAEKSGQSVIAMRRLSPDELPGLNKYELLGLDKLGIGVDADVLKRAYHKALLTYHPDKNAADQEAEEDEVFLAVQEAHAMLSDPTRRRAYDSTNEFDDSIPSGREADVQGSAFDFYATYAPVFRSNARFSTNPRVPDLGDDDSSNEEVQKFYEFWARFESWVRFVFAPHPRALASRAY
jgi:DnaJ family protein C protein 2